jgi:protein Mpv17
MFHTFFHRRYSFTRLQSILRFTSSQQHHHHRTFTSSSHTSSSSSYTRRLFEWYSDILDRRPYTTQMATSGFLGGIADVTTQYLEHGWDIKDGRQPKPWDLRRLAAVTSFGVFIMGPVGHIWYLQLDKFCQLYCKSKTSMIVTKVLGDTFLFGPAALWSFFASVSYMEGMEWNDIRNKLYREFVPTYIIDYSMWPIVQGTNFRYIPVRHQLMFVNTACYFDDIFLSYVEHNGLDRMPILRDIQVRMTHPL